MQLFALLQLGVALCLGWGMWRWFRGRTKESDLALARWTNDLKAINSAVSAGEKTWHVFICHPGELKGTFAASLKAHLDNRSPNVSVFLDELALHPGDDATSTIIRACGTARIGVVVLSEESVRKDWPMRELRVLMHRYESNNVKLVPVLFFEDFGQLKRCAEQCSPVFQQVLSRVQTVTMIRKEKKHLPDLLQEVGDSVMRHISDLGGLEFDYPRPKAVGLHQQVINLMEVVRAGKWLWLHGTGGVGKSTLARVLMHDLMATGGNEVLHTAIIKLEFTAGDGVSLSEADALYLLKLAVKDLTGIECIESSPQGVRRAFRNAVKLPGVLLIIDNVHSQKQIGLLLHDIVDTEAVVIFTSRSQEPLGGSTHVDTWLQVAPRLHMHSVDCLSLADSLELFRDGWAKPDTISDAVEKYVVQSCGGLPLAVLIMKGAVRWCASEIEWMRGAEALQSGARDPTAAILGQAEADLQEVIHHSLQGLPGAAVDMFLDCTCIMGGLHEADALLTWQHLHGPDASVLLQLLKSRHLVTTDAAGNLQVHDVLRWFGRRAALGKVIANRVLKGTRVWVQDGKIAGRRLQDKSWQGKVLAARLDEDLVDSRHSEAPVPFVGKVTHKFPRARVLLAGRNDVQIAAPNLLWLEMRGCACPDLAAIVRNKNMCILRLVDVEGLHMLPDDLGQLSALNDLNLEGCIGLTALPEGVGRLGALQKLNLAGCSKLTVLPEGVGELSALQMLNLAGCSKLVALPEGVGQLTTLQTLNLGSCSMLIALPEGLGGLIALQTLNLAGCSKLDALPEGVGQLTTLHTLDLSSCNKLITLPEGVGQLSALHMLNLRGCSGLTSLPAGVQQLRAHQELSLRGCKGLVSLPDQLEQLTALRVLDLYGCSGLLALPEGVGNLTLLHSLDLGRCSGLRVLPEGLQLLSALQTLNLGGCSGLTVLPEGLQLLSALQTLNLGGCTGLTVLHEGLGQLSALQTLNLGGCSGLTVLPEGLQLLSALQTLNLGGCSGLSVLPEGLGQLSALQTLRLYQCSNLTALPEGMGQLTALQTLHLGFCRGLTTLPEAVGQLCELQVLELEGCSGLTALPEGLVNLPKLRMLQIAECNKLDTVPERLTSFLFG